jgi:hypothetical protein
MDDRLKFLKMSRQFFIEYKQDMFWSKATEECISLLEFQRSRDKRNVAESKSSRPDRSMNLVDKSVSKSLEYFIRGGNNRDAEDLSKHYRVPAKRYQLLQISAYSRDGMWEDLYRLSTKSKPLSGWQCYIDACVSYGAVSEAARYISRLSDPSDRMEQFCGLGLWRNAAEVALKEKDDGALETIVAASGDPQLSIWISDHIRGGVILNA